MRTATIFEKQKRSTERFTRRFINVELLVLLQLSKQTIVL